MSNLSLPWEVLLLVSQNLDPKTLAIASCVCKSWSVSMSSDYLWKPICLSHHPSLSTLHLIEPTISYHRLYTLGHLSSNRRLRNPSVPRISLDQLIFTVDAFDGNHHIFSLVKSGDHLFDDRNEVFRFDINVSGDNVSTVDMSKEMRVTWTVVLKGWRGVFLVIDCEGKGRFVSGGEKWFSEELPSLGCCTSAGTSGYVAELGFGFCGDQGDGDGNKMRVDKVSMGLLSVFSWRYLSVDDALRYLQHFLLPSNL